PVLIIILFSLIIPVTHLRGDIDPDSKKGQTKFAKPTQEATLDWKVHNVGKIRQVVTNTGGINAVPEFNTEQGLHDYPGLLNCEFPPGSSVEHLFEAGIKVGSIQDGDTLVTVSNWNNQHINFEFFPTNSPNDTVWVVNKGDSVDIPYWPGYYKAIGDQDFVCKYSDYNVTNISIHTPLYIDVIQ
ncbi:MAG: hypothetical protein GWN00_11305, partial [Aliifodinibius sp.]|nr:hypothetical protein [candidate division Zixibacteria bacterium]NIT56787.1 hypothetical protein [Fodinibius sp.]NIW47488.1 hypothetical protein [Gammaproteobacteria bacterium]NIS46063.1 hypothetical protein [candidate division Zixibacteria bacterium]NIU14179.1 hypothetical protein [candidate division Zixibacteria bacterium]